jgi:hypothetical protein
VADRIALLVSLGGLLTDAERRGDTEAVCTLHDAMEAIVEAQGVIAVLERRRATDRGRKRGGRSTESRPSTESVESVESMDVGGIRGIRGNGGPPSPQVPSSSPEPLITPSSPPSPASSSSAAGRSVEELEVETRLLDRTATAAGGRSREILLRFLDHSEGVGRVSWVGRLMALLDAPPHFTPDELAEGLEAMMTEPRERWKPSVMKAWVRRVRSDAERVLERAPSGPADLRRADQAGQGNGAGGAATDAGTMFAAIRALVTERDVPGAGTHRYLPRAHVAALGHRVLAAYDNIGGSARFLSPSEPVGIVLRDFVREYGTLTGATP